MRKVGISAIDYRLSQREKFRAAGEKLASQQLEQLKEQLETFRETLREFASKNKKQIKMNPDFRRQFSYLCSLVGIDPLFSKKGFWQEFLDVGDFYYELGIHILQIGLVARTLYGGTIYMDDLIHQITKLRGEPIGSISETDISDSIKSISPLGPGVEIIKWGPTSLVCFSYREFNDDVRQLMAHFESLKCTDVYTSSAELSWPTERAFAALEELLMSEICWIDEQSDPHTYWILGHFMKNGSP